MSSRFRVKTSDTREITLDGVKSRNPKLYDFLTKISLKKLIYDEDASVLRVYTNEYGFGIYELKEMFDVGFQFVIGRSDGNLTLGFIFTL